jgi:hypothetical protein
VRRTTSRFGARRHLSRVLLGLGTLLAATVLPVTASAAADGTATPAAAPTITRAYCGSGITYWIECDAWWEGGTDPAVATWTAVSGAWINRSATDPVARHTIGYGNCIPGSFFVVKVTVTDAAGLSTSTQVPGGRRCPV